MSRLSLVRRRRWVRNRKCVSEQAIVQFEKSNAWVQSLLQQLRKILASREEEFKQVCDKRFCMQAISSFAIYLQIALF
jgi:hypothetical protein